MLDAIGSQPTRTLPPPPPPPPAGDKPSAAEGTTPETPQEKTDAARQDWQAAQTALGADRAAHAGRSAIDDAQAEVDRTRRAFDDAVKSEISADVADSIRGVPPEYRTPEDKLISRYGGEIAARYGADPQAQSEVKAVASDFQTQSKADSLIPTYFGNFSAADKLKGIDLSGQPPAVVDKVLANPLVQQWVRQAAADVGRPYQGVPPDAIPYAHAQSEQASGTLASTTEGLAPQLATAVTSASMPTVRKIAALDPSGVGGLVPFDTVQSVVSKLGSDAAAKEVIGQVAGAYVANPQASRSLTYGGANSPLASSIEFSPGYGAAGNPAFAIALGDKLAAAGRSDESRWAYAAAAQGVHDYLANNGGSPLKAYDDAHQAAQAKDSHLAELLANTGALTEKQQQAFIKAYRADPANAGAYKADAEAAKRLSDYMATNRSNLIYAAGRNPAAADQLYGAMKDLVQSGQGEGTLSMARAIANDPSAAAAFGRFSDYQNEFLQKAIPSAQAQALLESNGDTAAAAKKMLELADPIFKGKEGWSQVKENYLRLAQGETAAFDAAQLAEGYKKLGAAGKGWAIASIMTSSFNGATSSDITGMINGFADAGGSVDGIASGAVQAFADAGKFGAYTESAESLSKFGAKFLPGLSVIASGATFASDFGKAAQGNPAYGMALAGDVLASIGSVLETTGVGEVPGALVTGIGTALAAPFQLAGAIIDGNKERKEFRDEQLKYLCAAQVDKGEAEILARDGDQTRLLGSQLGMRPEDVQALARSHPELFDGPPGNTQAIVSAIQGLGLKPSDVGGFVDALSADSRRSSGDPTAYMSRLAAMYSSNPASGVDQERVRSNQLASTALEGSPSAAAYAAQHAPDATGPAAEARRRADAQFGTVQNMGSDGPANIANLLKSDRDPAYRAEIVSDMKRDGTLDGWVSNIASEYAYNGWPEAARSAIRAAQQAGVLTADEAGRYLRQLG